MLHNGFGEHNIQGIGDKHIPFIHNVMNTDFVAGVSDRATDTLYVLFNTEAGRAYLRDRRGVPEKTIADARVRSGSPASATCWRRSRPRSTSTSVPNDAIVTVATDGAAMYGTERAKAIAKYFPDGFDAVDAAETFGRHMLGQATDDLLELGHDDRERIFNLGYFTWVEQQGVSARRVRRAQEAVVLARPARVRAGVGRDDRRVQRAGERPVTGTRLVCQGCGAAIGPNDAPYQCPNTGRDGGNHVVGRILDPTVRFPSGSSEPNPFVRYRDLSYAHAIALAGGIDDDAFVGIVRQLDAAIAAAWGTGFRITPFGPNPALSDAIGATVWVKDETINVSGSHKGRHLAGLAILGEIRARLGLDPATGSRLAIASCGNAALAAAVVAKAWGKPLDVFIPGDANANVVAKLHALGADVHVCKRDPAVPGDPCTHAFRAAVAAGSSPFCCQGTDNGLTIEGGETLAWEMVDQLGGQRLDRLFVQVGGGALASACIQGFEEAGKLGVPVKPPRLHAVQTRGGFPLWRAWDRLARRIGRRLAITFPEGDAELALAIAPYASSALVEDELRYAVHHRAEFMWPWETEPHSVAHGILDDETYDWQAIVRGMIATGGYPIVVDDARLIEANALGRSATGIDADETGTAGLAGLLEMRGELNPDETVAVIFSGHRR